MQVVFLVLYSTVCYKNCEGIGHQSYVTETRRKQIEPSRNVGRDSYAFQLCRIRANSASMWNFFNFGGCDISLE